MSTKTNTSPGHRDRIKRALSRFSHWFTALSKPKKIALVTGIILLLVSIVFGILMLLPKEAAAPQVVKKEAPVVEAPKPTTEASKLTGLQVDPTLNKRPVTGVMIENSPDARPQSGLTSAGVVFEAIAEGGITRFLALYQDTQPDYIGPVRSVRPYYLDWLQGFDAAIAHAGGSAEALAKIKSDGVKDLDQFFNAGTYQRVKGRYAPHNLYTSSAKLDALQAAKGFTSSTFDSFTRKADAKLATPTAKSIDLSISGFYYNPRYEYDATTNTYKRSMQGKPHIDEKSGKQIAPSVVIANVMQYRIIDREGHSGYNTIGSGPSYIFQDGGVTVGTWEKASRTAQIIFKDANGAVLPLNAGQTWISAVNNSGSVKYTP